MNFAKFLRTPFIKEHLWWLLLRFLYHSYFYETFLPVNTTLEEYKVIYPERISDHITKDDFRGVHAIPL